MVIYKRQQHDRHLPDCIVFAAGKQRFGDKVINGAEPIETFPGDIGRDQAVIERSVRFDAIYDAIDGPYRVRDAGGKFLKARPVRSAGKERRVRIRATVALDPHTADRQDGGRIAGDICNGRKRFVGKWIGRFALSI